MKSTLSDINQLFVLSALTAAGKKPEEIVDGEFAIVDDATELTVTPAAFADLPDSFRFISKKRNKVYYSLDSISKSAIYNANTSEYQPEEVNVWKTTIESCDCTKGIELHIGLNEDSLVRRDGLTWTHKDSIIAVSPKELECFCDCSGKGVYDNHVMTKLLYDYIQASNSPYYEAEVQQEDGTAFADADAIQAFIDAGKAANTDADTTNNGAKLVLVLKGKAQPASYFNDLEVNYVYPRGVKLQPALVINGETKVPFEEVDPLVFELGAGADYKKQEFDVMNFQSNLNFYPQLSDKIQSSNLVYQVDSDKNYDAIGFEYGSKKSGQSSVFESDTKKAGMILLAETGSAEATALKALFTV